MVDEGERLPIVKPEAAKVKQRRPWKSTNWKRVVRATVATALCLCVASALVLFEGWSGSALDAPTLESAAESTTSSSETNLQSGQEILLRIRGKPNLCADDGGGDDTLFTGQPCNPSNPNQLFIYDTQTRQFRSARKTGLCLDDGGGWAGLSKVKLNKCNVKSENQRFVLDAAKLLLKNTAKDGYCLDDGGGDTAGASQFTFWVCSDKSDNQHFEILSQASLASEQKKVLDAVASGAKFLLRMAGTKGLCASGDKTSAASTSFTFATCDKQSADQLFSYDASTKRFKSSEKKDFCLDDGGGKAASKTDIRLMKCNSNSLDQSFVYNATTMLLAQPNKAGLCLDDGDDKWLSLAAAKLILRACNAYSPYQHFEFVLQSEPVTTAPIVATTVVSTPVTTAAVVTTPVVTATQVGTASTPMATASTPQLTAATASVVSTTSAPQMTTYTPTVPEVTTAASTTPAKTADDSTVSPTTATAKATITSSGYTSDATQSTTAVTKPTTESVVTTPTSVQTNAESQQAVSGVESISANYNTVPQQTASTVANEVKRQYMTKLEFYNEIKDHFMKKYESMNGSAGMSLRLEGLKEREKKLNDCIDESATRFGSESASVTSKQLFEQAIAWIDNTCLQA